MEQVKVSPYRAKEVQIINQLRSQRERLEFIYKQKFREIWLKESDCNSKILSCEYYYLKKTKLY